MIRRALRIAFVAGFLGSGNASQALSPAFEQLTASAKSAMMSDPALARMRSNKVIDLALPMSPSVDRDLAIATAEWLSGEASLRMSDVAKADQDIKAGLQIVQARAPGSQLHGDLLLSQGGVESAKLAPDRALRSYLAAHAIYARLKNARQQAITLLDIGSIYQNAEDYERVLYYCQLAADIYREDPIIALSISNNRANALVQLERYAEAEKEYGNALALAAKLNNPLLEARVLHNIARAEIDDEDYISAKRTVARGLRLTSSGDAAAWRPFFTDNLARIALKEGRNEEAAVLIAQSLKSSEGRSDTQVYRSMHFTAYTAFRRLGRNREALAELETLKKLDDEARSLAASTNSALLAARFDFANQNTRIATLKAGQLQRDIALSELRARQTLITLGSALLVVLGGLVFLIINLRSVKRSRDAVAAANAELTRTNVQLQEALRAKSKFLATTSHEIRTPLNGILGMAQVILAEPALAPGVRERIELLQGAGTTMRALVDDILDFASLDAGRLDIQRGDADLPKLLGEIVAFWRGPATRGGLDLTLDVDPGLRMINEDVRRLRQVLFNLLSNAVKFTPDGKIDVRAWSETAGEGEQLVITVADSGIGIPASELARIFEEFHQVDTGRTRQFSGSGLGLAISRALAVAMGGTLDVASEAGRGSTFTVRLPLRRVEVAEPLARHFTSPGQSRDLSSATIIVVAGNPLADATLRALLGGRVAAYVAAPSCEDAALRCEDGGIDLVLVEGAALQAAGDAGMTALRALVDKTAASSVAVALLWKATPDAPVPLDARLHVIAKPVAGDRLIAALDRILTKRVDIDVGTSPKDVSGEAAGAAGRRHATAAA